MAFRIVVAEPIGEAVRKELEKLDHDLRLVEASLSARALAELREAGADGAIVRVGPRLSDVDRTFGIRLENEYLRAIRYRHPLGLILVSVDHAEEIAEAHGEDALEGLVEVLRESFRRAVRVVDMIFRTDRSEMAVVLPETALAGARTVADRLRAQTSHLLYKPPGGDARPHLPIKTTSSIGVVDAPREGIGSGVEFLEIARQAVYRARAQGGDRIEEPAG